jgi:hypothetical protein
MSHCHNFGNEWKPLRLYKVAGYRLDGAGSLKISLLRHRSSSIHLCEYLRLNPCLVSQNKRRSVSTIIHTKVKERLFHRKLHFHAGRMEGVISEIVSQGL